MSSSVSKEVLGAAAAPHKEEQAAMYLSEPQGRARDEVVSHLTR